MTDDDLDAFLGATCRHLDAEIAASNARPDLAASVARAHEIDPAAVDPVAVREVADLPPIAQLRPRPASGLETMSDRTAIAPFAAELRDHIEAELARAIHRVAIAGHNPTISNANTSAANATTANTTANATTANTTANATTANATTANATANATTANANAIATTANATATPAPLVVAPARMRRPLVALSLALAAALLLAFGLRGALEARQARPGAIPGAAALAGRLGTSDHVEPRDPARSAREQAVPKDILPVPEDSSNAPAPKDSFTAPAEPEGPKGPKEPGAPTEREPRPRPHKPERVTPPPAPSDTTTPEDPLSALDREAQARWQSGDLRGAADKFAEIVQRAPGSRAAETAYGDLFALENQLGGDLVSLWRAYLRQFPRGRYADDARAGVCRRAPADARISCWRDYLAAHPDGAHRPEAERAAEQAAEQAAP